MSATTEFLALQAAVAGRFSLVSEVGRGGMGIVFLAHDVLLERPVAIKLLSPALSARPEMRRRFLREARIAAQCFHPHIVPIHAVEEAGDLAYFIMAYVRGETLAERLHRVGPLRAEQVRRVAREVGWALSYAHDRGVIHRDVKPENILLEDGSDRALIADFGIALHEDPSRTPASGEVAGTARFMAPEQALGEVIDGRADLYALGVTLYVAATGRYPFQAATSLALVAQQSLHRARPLREDAPDIPESLANAIDHCLAIRADDRFGSAAAFVDALAVAPTDTPVLPALARVRDGANAALVLWGWSQVFNVTTGVLRWGESSPIGSAIIGTLGVGITILTFTAAILRGIETSLAARKAVRDGVPGSDVASALGGSSAAAHHTPPPTGEKRAMGLAMVGIGAALGYAQGAVSSGFIPDPFSGFLQVALLVLPPFLIGRGAADVLRQSPVTRWLQRKVRQPLANVLTRMLGGDTRPSARRPALESTRTEVVLAQAASDLFARLPAATRAALGELPAAATELAREADKLRTREHRLASDDRAARLLATGEREVALERIESERAIVRARLATAVAALEAIRMDLLRLETGDTAPGLTVQLEIVRDLQRRVDAEADVRALLATPLLEHTPA